MTPVRIPGSAAGKVTATNVWKRLAPRASDPSLYDAGTLRMASSLARIITGSVRTASVMEAARMHGLGSKPNSGNRNSTKKARPKSPKTMLGTPASVLMPMRMMRIVQPSEAHSTR